MLRIRRNGALGRIRIIDTRIFSPRGLAAISSFGGKISPFPQAVLVSYQLNVVLPESIQHTTRQAYLVVALQFLGKVLQG